MRRLATIVLSVSLFAVLASTGSQATKYPPGPDGPGGACNDSATIYQIQNLSDPCNPPANTGASADSVYGVGGVVTGIDLRATGFAFYIQNNALEGVGGGAPWRGIDIFTAAENYAGNNLLQLGDSVVVSGKLDEFGDGSEIRALNRGFSNPNNIIRVVSHNLTLHPIPHFHVGTATELKADPLQPDGEQWEGCLVRVNGPLRVVRHTGLGGRTSDESLDANCLVVDDSDCPDGSGGPCDSLFIDTATLAGLISPNVPTQIDYVQGIFDQRSTGYELQIRNADDWAVVAPPNLVDAYPVADDTVRLVFDKDILASSVPTASYVLTSGRPVLSKTLVEPRVIHIAIDLSNPGTGIEADGDNETVTCANIRDSAHNLPMGSQSKDFVDGVIPIALIQAPKTGAGGLGANPCVDGSKYAGALGTPGKRLTFRGIATAKYGNITYLQDPGVGGPRKGMSMFATVAPLVVGHKYLIAGAVQEFFTETEGTQNVYMRDEGVATIPDPVIEPISVLRDTSCDVNQAYLNGEDFEGVLVKIVDARTTTRNPSSFFFVAGPAPTYPDTIDITLRSGVYTYQSSWGHHVNVTGILAPFNGFNDLNPRSNADIVDLAPAGVGDGLPRQVEFNVFPNPAHTARVSFALPAAAEVRISVFDLAGRKVADVASGRFPAGTHSREWNGRDIRGHAVSSGVYFYHCQVGEQTLIKRAVKLN